MVLCVLRSRALMTRKFGCGLLVLALSWGRGAPAAWGAWAVRHTGSAALSQAGSGALSQAGSAGGQSTVAHRRPGYLGIDVKDVSDDEISALKLKDAHGAEIIRVDHDGPAGKMGLREHDVVVQMNGAAIVGEEQIRRLLRDIAPGRTVALVISRDGQQMTLIAQMADHGDVVRQAWEQHLAIPPAPAAQSSGTGLPEDGDQASGTEASAGAAPASKYSKSLLDTLLMTPAYTGVLLERMGPQLGEFFGVPKGTGLLVKSVANNSPAMQAGIHAGDVVLRANAKPVGTMTDWSKAVRDAKGKPITVVVLRDRKEQTVTLTPDPKKHTEFRLPVPWERATDAVKVASLLSSGL